MSPDPLATVAASSVVKTMADVLLRPTLEKLRDNVAIKAKVAIDLFVNSFEDYLHRSYEKYFYLPTIVFPNQKKSLKTLYIPLRISAGPQDAGSILIDKYPRDLFDSNKDVLIVDTAGMGKSTITKFVLLDVIETNSVIPIIIELRKLSKSKTIIDFIYDEINGLKYEIDKKFLAHVIERGDFIFLLDGYDEIPSEHKAEVTADLQSFKFKANRNKFLLTSRDEPGLASFSEFQRFNILPLELHEALELIRKYSIDSRVSESLIERIQEPEYQPIREFLKNPLLVSLLYKSYEYKPTVPLKLSVFYRQVYESLFENHDFSKGGDFQRKKKSGLDIDQFHSMLRAFAYTTYKEGKTELGGDELLVKIGESKRLCSGLSFSNSDFKNDLIHNVPLLINDGDRYRWSHKSIQEYFTACFVCMDTKAKEVEVLNRLYASPQVQHHANMLMLCYDIDYKTFRRTIVRNLLIAVIEAVDAAQLSLGASISASAIMKRKQYTHFTDWILINTEQLVKKNGAPDPISDAFTQAHIEAAKLATNSAHSSSRTTWSAPTAFCVVYHQLKEIVSRLATKPENDFVCVLVPRPPFSAIVPPDADSAFFPLDDSPKNPLNAPEVFDSVTQMIAERSEFKFDLGKARQVLQAIDKEIHTESETDFSII